MTKIEKEAEERRIERAVAGIPARLKEIRGDRTQRQFAIELDVFQQNINRYEQGTVPSAPFLVRLAGRENVDLHWLLTGEA